MKGIVTCMAKGQQFSFFNPMYYVFEINIHLELRIFIT